MARSTASRAGLIHLVDRQVGIAAAAARRGLDAFDPPGSGGSEGKARRQAREILAHAARPDPQGLLPSGALVPIRCRRAREGPAPQALLEAAVDDSGQGVLRAAGSGDGKNNESREKGKWFHGQSAASVFCTI